MIIARIFVYALGLLVLSGAIYLGIKVTLTWLAKGSRGNGVKPQDECERGDHCRHGKGTPKHNNDPKR